MKTTKRAWKTTKANTNTWKMIMGRYDTRLDHTSLVELWFTVASIQIPNCLWLTFLSWPYHSYVNGSNQRKEMTLEREESSWTLHMPHCWNLLNALVVNTVWERQRVEKNTHVHVVGSKEINTYLQFIIQSLSTKLPRGVKKESGDFISLSWLLIHRQINILALPQTIYKI